MSENKPFSREQLYKPRNSSTFAKKPEITPINSVENELLGKVEDLKTAIIEKIMFLRERIGSFSKISVFTGFPDSSLKHWSKGRKLPKRIKNLIHIFNQLNKATSKFPHEQGAVISSGNFER